MTTSETKYAIFNRDNAKYLVSANNDLTKNYSWHWKKSPVLFTRKEPLEASLYIWRNDYPNFEIHEFSITTTQSTTHQMEVDICDKLVVLEDALFKNSSNRRSSIIAHFIETLAYHKRYIVFVPIKFGDTIARRTEMFAKEKLAKEQIKNILKKGRITIIESFAEKNILVASTDDLALIVLVKLTLIDLQNVEIYDSVDNKMIT